MKIYEFKIIDENDENTGVYAMSLVDKPAIEIGYVKLSETPTPTPAGDTQVTQVKEVKYTVTNEDEQIVTGPAMIPDKLIYRSAEQLYGEEGYIKMSAETIKTVAHNYLKRETNNEVTLDHESDTTGVKMIESWLIEDNTCDKAIKLGYSDLPIGTWMVSYKVEDDELWEKVKAGDYNGFSIEGMFNVVEIETEETVKDLPIEQETIETPMDEIYETITQVLNNYKNGK